MPAPALTLQPVEGVLGLEGDAALLAAGDGRFIALEVADGPSVELAVCQRHVPAGTRQVPPARPSFLLASVIAWPRLSLAGQTQGGGGAGSWAKVPRHCREGEGSRLAQGGQGSRGSAGRKGEGPRVSCLTDHDSCGAVLGVKGAASLPVLQHHLPRRVPLQAEVLHILQQDEAVSQQHLSQGQGPRCRALLAWGDLLLYSRCRRRRG